VSDYSYGSNLRGDDPANRLFGARFNHRATTSPQAYSRPGDARLVSLDRSTLCIAPFAILRWGLVYISPMQLTIDLDQLPVAVYRIVAVHNFRAEDCNPQLDECLAGIFLARARGDAWEVAEDPPTECRTIQVLGHVDSSSRRLFRP
jgi:hypothetical protein